MKHIKILITLISLYLMIGCGSSEGESSSFRIKAPVIEGENIYFVDENTREAFQIEAKDNSSLKYYVSGGDSNLLYVDLLSGEVFFKEPTDFERKNTYNFTIIIEDSVGNRTSKDITIKVKDDPNETVIVTTEHNNSLPQNNEYFITTWHTNQPGASARNQITIPTLGDGYNYNVDWGDGKSSENLTLNATHTYKQMGIYKVKIIGDFPRIVFGTSNTDHQKLLSIDQWGDNIWSSMGDSFSTCSNMVMYSQDVPNLSKVTNMHNMFAFTSKFNQDISSWDVSHVTNMRWMFNKAEAFNQNISEWDVSNVTNMEGMFNHAYSFNQDIGLWDVSKVTNMDYTLTHAEAFDQDLSLWHVHNVQSHEAFAYAAAEGIIEPDWEGTSIIPCISETKLRDMIRQNQDVSNVNTGCITNMSSLFTDSNFNQDISKWDTSNVTNMSFMFAGMSVYREGGQIYTLFNQDISSWDVSKVTDMRYMFMNSNFNQDLSSWDVSNVRTMHSMIEGGSFNKDISNWNVSNVTDMSDMFKNGSFNKDISNWNVSNVTNMSSMFSNGNFDQNISNWNVKNVTNMSSMFSYGNFNQNISNWNVSNVTNMNSMFSYGNFNQDISKWNVSNVTNMKRMFMDAHTFNQDLSAWNVLNVTDMRSLFKNAYAFNQNLNNWNIQNVIDHRDFATNTAGTIEPNWSEENNHPCLTEGELEAKIANNEDVTKVNLACVREMNQLFSRNPTFNQDISAWDVSSVIDMSYMFEGTTEFNQDINAWDVSNVTNMMYMFEDANKFNQNISAWNVANVSNMRSMFKNSSEFNQDLSRWNVEKVIYHQDFSKNAKNIIEPNWKQ